MRRLLTLQVVVTLLLNVVGLTAFSGCSKKVQKTDMLDFQTAAVQAPQKAAKPVEDSGVLAFPAEAEPVVTPSSEPLVVVYFDFDSARLLPQEAMKLDRLLGQNLKLRIVGHACTFGTNEYNMGLSIDRANRIAKYCGGGEVIGFGEEMCTASCAQVYEQECRECRCVKIYAN